MSSPEPSLTVGPVSQFRGKDWARTMLVFVLLLVFLGLRISIASETADEVQAALSGPLAQAFDRPMTGEVVYEGNQSVAQVIGLKYNLGNELGPDWGKRVVQALTTAGATGAEITARDDWGPTEVTAERLLIAGKTMLSIQFTASVEDKSIAAVLMYLQM